MELVAAQGIILFFVSHVISNLLLKLHGVYVCILSLNNFILFFTYNLFLLLSYFGFFQTKAECVVLILCIYRNTHPHPAPLTCFTFQIIHVEMHKIF